MKTNHVVYGQDRIALVTGGSSGIGLAMACLLARQGSHVWVIARQEAKLASALEKIKAARQSDLQHFGTISADVSDPKQVFAAVEQVVKEIGVPHLMVNSAGVARPGYFHEMSVEDFHSMMDINYFGTVHMAKAVVPGMVERGWGHIVNISSILGFMGFFGYTAYGATKFAITGFTDILRSELKPQGIGVSIVFPPDVDTPQLAYESQFRPPETRALIDGGSILSPESVAATILHGISRRQYIIIPGTMGKALYGLTHTLNGVAYPVLDWMVAQAHAKINGKS